MILATLYGVYCSVQHLPGLPNESSQAADGCATHIIISAGNTASSNDCSQITSSRRRWPSYCSKFILTCGSLSGQIRRPSVTGLPSLSNSRGMIPQKQKHSANPMNGLRNQTNSSRAPAFRRMLKTAATRLSHPASSVHHILAELMSSA